MVCNCRPSFRFAYTHAKASDDGCQVGHGRIENSEKAMACKLILRDKEYTVRAGMTLLDALKKSNILPESVISTRDGEMITEDEILKEDDVIRLIAVISGR